MALLKPLHHVAGPLVVPERDRIKHGFAAGVDEHGPVHLTAGRRSRRSGLGRRLQT